MDALSLSLASVMSNNAAFFTFTAPFMTVFVNTYASDSFMLLFYFLTFCFLGLLLLTPFNVLCLNEVAYMVDFTAM